MIRKLLFVMATGACLIGPSAIGAQAADTVVVVESPPPGVTTFEGGTLTREAASGPSGFVAVYVGLSALGLTLATISHQRRSKMRSPVPEGFAHAYGRRSLADFWAPAEPDRIPMAAASARPGLRTRPLPWPRRATERRVPQPAAAMLPPSRENAHS